MHAYKAMHGPQAQIDVKDETIYTHINRQIKLISGVLEALKVAELGYIYFIVLKIAWQAFLASRPYISCFHLYHLLLTYSNNLNILCIQYDLILLPF